MERETCQKTGLGTKIWLFFRENCDKKVLEKKQKPQEQDEDAFNKNTGFLQEKQQE